jgi:hypothetical protein
MKFLTKCFDLGTWLSSYPSRPHINFSCPVCGKGIDLSSIALDEYAQEVLSETAKDDLQDVKILKDGNWIS